MTHAHIHTYTFSAPLIESFVISIVRPPVKHNDNSKQETSTQEENHNQRNTKLFRFEQRQHKANQSIFTNTATSAPSGNDKRQETKKQNKNKTQKQKQKQETKPSCPEGQMQCLLLSGLCPFAREHRVAVSVAVEALQRLLGIVPEFEVDVGKALCVPGALVLGKEEPAQVAKWLAELAQVLVILDDAEHQRDRADTHGAARLS